jgi:hypothetical protein
VPSGDSDLSFDRGSTCQNIVDLVNGKYELDTPTPP